MSLFFRHKVVGFADSKEGVTYQDCPILASKSLILGRFQGILEKSERIV
jgi:hypothetical protein